MCLTASGCDTQWVHMTPDLPASGGPITAPLVHNELPVRASLQDSRKHAFPAQPVASQADKEDLPPFQLSWDGREPSSRTRQARRRQARWVSRKLLSRCKHPGVGRASTPTNLCREAWGVSSPSVDSVPSTSGPPGAAVPIRMFTTSPFFSQILMVVALLLTAATAQQTGSGPH